MKNEKGTVIIVTLAFPPTPPPTPHEGIKCTDYKAERDSHEKTSFN